MKATRVFLAGVAGLALMVTVPAFAQRDWDRDRDDRSWGWHQDRDHDRDDDRGFHDRDDRQAYKNGYKDGMRDRREGRNWAMRNNRYHERDDREAYAAGYRAGYNDAARRGPGRGGWGGYGRNPFNAGQQTGYQDGLRYGSHDRQVRKPYRPTDSQAYQDADHGYSSSLGSRDEYKRGYRQGYEQAYQRAYYGR